MAQTYDIYDALTGDELDQVTNIFLEALARSECIVPEVFEIETNIIVEWYETNSINPRWGVNLQLWWFTLFY